MNAEPIAVFDLDEPLVLPVAELLLPEQQRPVQEMLPIHQLHVVEEFPNGYQRPLRRGRLRELREHWDWRQVRTLDVSRRVGGEFEGLLFVWNGQHRMEAARELFSDELLLPCLVVPLTYEEEADLFARQNEGSVVVSRRDRFGAKIERKDKDAIALREIVERQGWLVATSQAHTNRRAITAVALLEAIYADYGAHILDLTLSTAASAYGYRSDAVSERMLGGLSHFLHHFRVVNIKELIGKLVRPEGQPIAILQRSAFYGGARGSGRHIAVSRAILDRYNHGKHEKNRLDWDLKKYR